MSLGAEDLERYSRQLVLPEWSGAAQERLGAASAVVVGAGALGCPAAAYLAGAGIGRLGVVDSDVVSLSDLHRQPLHSTPDIGSSKAESAAAKLRLLNPGCLVESYPARLEEANADAMLAGADVVVDCSDTFATRYLVNDTCCALGIPLVEGGVLGFAGLVLAIRPGETACYRCAFPVEPRAGSVPSCREAGVLGPTAGIVGSMQALEALKLVAGAAPALTDAIVTLDAATLELTHVRTSRREGCAACAPQSRA